MASNDRLMTSAPATSPSEYQTYPAAVLSRKSNEREDDDFGDDAGFVRDSVDAESFETGDEEEDDDESVRGLKGR